MALGQDVAEIKYDVKALRRRPISELRMPINAMCAVPLGIWGELVRKGGN